MSNNSTIGLTIEFIEPALNREELNEEVRWLENQLQFLDGIESISRVRAPASPEAVKGGPLEILVGVLTTQITPELFKQCIQKLFSFTADKHVKFSIEFPDGRKTMIDVANLEDAERVMVLIAQFQKS